MQKLLTIISDSAIDETMMELLGELGVQGFTTIFDSHGRGGRGPKESTPVWPGTNHLLLIAAPEPLIWIVRIVGLGLTFLLIADALWRARARSMAANNPEADLA